MGASLLLFWLVRYFLNPVFWAVVLAILFAPVHARIRDRLAGRPSLAAGISVTVILVLVILPLTLVGVAVGRELAALYDRVQSGQLDVQAPLAFLERVVPRVGQFLGQFGVEMDRVRQGLSEAAISASKMLAPKALGVGQDALRLLLAIAVTLYLLFFFLRDSDGILSSIMRAVPLGDVRERRLMARFASITRATIKGTLLVGLAQGMLAGITFALLGIPSAALWGVLMTILSVLPAVGSGIIWAPAAVILLLTGSIAKGVILLTVGILLISLIDNVLRPILVGRETRMPDWLIMIAILGGLTSVGLSGFVIGPIVAGLFLTIWEMFVEDRGVDAPADDAPPAEAPAVPSAHGRPVPVDDNAAPPVDGGGTGPADQ